MDPLSATASIIAILQLSARVLSYLNDVKDTSKGHAQCTIEASNIHNLLTNLRFRLEEGRGHQPWFTTVQALAVENGPLDQFKQALETLQAKMTGGGQLKKFGRALVWKFKKEELDAILARMERLKTLIEIALQIDHFKLSQAIKDDTDSIRTDVLAIQSTVEKFQHTQATASQRGILDWLSSSDYPAQQSDIIKRRQEGTGQWFLDAPEVARWLKEAKATLFCPGIPGAGKTMIAAIAIDQLLNSAPNGGRGVAYVYCNYKSQKDQDTTGILAAMLKQLGQGQPSALGPIERLYQKYSGQGTKLTLDDVCSALRDVVLQLPRVYIVVDALDECQSETRWELVAKLRDLQAVADVRLMATSRFVPDVEDAFRLTPRLEIKASDEDVKWFLAGQTFRLPACIRRNAALQNMVQEKIVEAVDGMFLLARLHLDSLVDKRTVKDVKATLAKLLKGAAALDGLYSDALTRIEGQLDGDHKLAKNVLTWITFAKRPLTTGEICCALAVEPGETELDPENKPDLDDILSVCAGLVVVDRESAIIRLVHYTTQEYFERNSFRISLDGEVPIAERCLTYLLFSVFESGSCATDKQLEERLSQHELLDYAAKHGGEHARNVEDEVIHLLYALLTHNGIFSCAAQALSSSFRHRAHSENESEFTGLHWAAQFGLSKVAILLLDNGADVDARYVYAGNALWIASSEGHMQFVEMLLEQGASVDTLGAEYSSELQVAAEEGHHELVEMLLKAGAYVNAQSGYYGTALYAASFRGHEKIVKMLLDAGADVNAPGEEGNCALYVASEEGYEKVVKLLLDAGANLNNLDQGEALVAASLRGHAQVVKLFLDAYRNVDINDVGGDDALYMAALEGHEEVVVMLLDAGADVDVDVGVYGNALQAASHKGHTQVVKLLLDAYGNVDISNVGGDDALYMAALEGHEEVVAMLLDAGADVDVDVGVYGNALQAASHKGHKQIVKLLMEKGAS